MITVDKKQVEDWDSMSSYDHIIRSKVGRHAS
jgi:hypothetical protein